MSHTSNLHHRLVYQHIQQLLFCRRGRLVGHEYNSSMLKSSFTLSSWNDLALSRLLALPSRRWICRNSLFNSWISSSRMRALMPVSVTSLKAPKQSCHCLDCLDRARSVIAHRFVGEICGRDAVKVIASCLMQITHTRLWCQFKKHFFELVHAAAANRYDHAGAREIERKVDLL